MFNRIIKHTRRGRFYVNVAVCTKVHAPGVYEVRFHCFENLTMKSVLHLVREYGWAGFQVLDHQDNVVPMDGQVELVTHQKGEG